MPRNWWTNKTKRTKSDTFDLLSNAMKTLSFTHSLLTQFFFSLDFLIQNRMKSGEIWKSDSRTSSIDTRQSFIIVTNVRVIWISEIKLKKNERRMRKSSHSNGTIFALFFANEKKILRWGQWQRRLRQWCREMRAKSIHERRDLFETRFFVFFFFFFEALCCRACHVFKWWQNEWANVLKIDRNCSCWSVTAKQQSEHNERRWAEEENRNLFISPNIGFESKFIRSNISVCLKQFLFASLVRPSLGQLFSSSSHCCLVILFQSIPFDFSRVYLEHLQHISAYIFLVARNLNFVFSRFVSLTRSSSELTATNQLNLTSNNKKTDLK